MEREVRIRSVYRLGEVEPYLGIVVKAVLPWREGDAVSFGLGPERRDFVVRRIERRHIDALYPGQHDELAIIFDIEPVGVPPS